MNENSFLGKPLFVHDQLYDAVIIGSGAAAYNAAIHLNNKGVSNIAIITENRLAGTSRNTGSDKQTYYKVSCAGNQKDSPRDMAETLFSGGAMDGDIALCEAGHSLEEFFHLVSLGVNFPHNRYGEYAGYKTDNDPLQRASSIGPYTSKKMTEFLEREAMAKNIPVIDKTRVIKVLVNSGRSIGVLCLESSGNFKIFLSKNCIFASGGPAGLYKNSVYPESQFGASGILAAEGIIFSNMAEWQYGIGSIKYRWNLSGSYQQVIPRYVSIDKNGVEYEFLVSYFSNIKNMVKAIFSKGYEWPFDPGKIVNERSSVIDIAVYIEKYILNRKVFLDFTKNPGYKKSVASFDIRDLDPTAHDYLYRSQAIGCTPVDRLKKLNLDAYELYRSQNIDLENEYLEIDILPQHHNGGAEINIWWETSVLHLFAIGECAGSHGVHRPGGAALNSGQTGGLRAASYIAAHVFKDNVFINYTELIDQILKEIKIFEKEIYNSFSNSSCDDAHSLLVHIQKKNNKYISFLRSENSILTTLDELNKLSEKKANPSENPGDYFRYREILLLSRMFCHAVLFYINKGGKSRGSHLILDNFNDITTITRNPDQNQKKNDDGKQYKNKIINTRYDPAKDEIVSYMRPVRPLPSSDTWFENIWHEYHNGTIWTIPPSEQI